MAKDEAYYEAEKRIEALLKSSATGLYLANLQLNELPESIGQLEKLTWLNLSRNNLTILPDLLVRQLLQLTELDLSFNQLRTLPDSLGELTQLKNLNLANNEFTSVPEVIRKLKKLEYLNISNVVTSNVDVSNFNKIPF